MAHVMSTAQAGGCVETTATNWVAAVAAIVSVIGIPLQIVAFIIAPPPPTVPGYFQLFQQNRLLELALAFLRKSSRCEPVNFAAGN